MNRHNYEGLGRHRRPDSGRHRRLHRRQSRLHQLDPAVAAQFPLGQLMVIGAVGLFALVVAAGEVVPADSEARSTELVSASVAAPPEPALAAAATVPEVRKCLHEPVEEPVVRKESPLYRPVALESAEAAGRWAAMSMGDGEDED